MNLLAITPQEFEAAALTWIGVLTAIVVALGAAVAKVWPILSAVKTRLDEMHDRQNRLSTRQNTQDQTVAQVALSVPPAPPTPLTPPTQ